MIRDIEAGIDIAAPPRHVWAVMTDAETAGRWLGSLNFQTSVGHIFHMQPDGQKRVAGDITGASLCKIIACEPLQRLAFTWRAGEAPPTMVQFELLLAAGGARVELVHDGWRAFDPAVEPIRDALEQGWTALVLPNLKRLAEEG